MKVMTPVEVIRSLLWIREAQDHVNSCANEFNDPASLAAALELQQSIDDEWDALGTLVANRPRPYSALHQRVREPQLHISAQAGSSQLL